MSLIKIAEANVTTSQSSVTLTGFTTDYPVYWLVCSNLEVDSSTYQHILMQYTVSGSADTGALYYFTQQNADANGNIYTGGGGTQTSISITNQIDNVNNGFSDYELYIFNPAKTDEYTYSTYEGVDLRRDAVVAFGRKGGFYYRSDKAHDGVYFFGESGANIKGHFILYALVV